MSDERDFDPKIKRKEYGLLVSMVQYEGNLLWTILGAFLVAEAVLLGLLGNALSDSAIIQWKPFVFFGAILGALLCLPWLASFMRNSAYYEFRIFQAKNLEERLGYAIFTEGERFSRGESIPINGDSLQIPCLSQYLRTKISGRLLIALFAAAFVTLAIISGPWW